MQAPKNVCKLFVSKCQITGEVCCFAKVKQIIE